MFTKVIIGVNGERGGRDAIALAKQLVDKDGELVLSYVQSGYPITFTAGAPTTEASQAQATAVLEAAASESGITKVLQIRSPHVGQGLHMLAEREAADLLVIGSTGHGLFDRVLVGNDTSEALNGAPCAVAVAPAGYADGERQMTEIGAAYDGSSESENAVAVARQLATAFGSKLSAMQVIVLASKSDAGMALPLSHRNEERLSEARDRITELGGVEAHAAVGDATEELAAYSAGVDLLVVGSRDYGPLGRLVHSSTSKRLAQTARSPLLILTRAARSAQKNEDVREVTGATA